MNLKPQVVNFNYEEQLAGVQLRPRKFWRMIARKYEWIYFFMEKSGAPLLTEIDYSADQLKEYERRGALIPPIIKGRWGREITMENFARGDFEFWWGGLKNRELEKKLNSKLWGAEFKKKLSLKFSEMSFEVRSLIELKSVIASNPNINSWIIKLPFSSSGIGALPFTSSEVGESALKLKLKVFFSKASKLLLMPFYQHKKFDFSYKPILKNQSVQNFKIFWKLTHVNSGLSSGLSVQQLSINKLENPPAEEKMRDIIVALMDLGARPPFCIDGVAFDQNGKVKIDYMLDINYRKSLMDFKGKA